MAESPTPGATRYAAVTRVLARVLLLNVAVAAAKIAFGHATGAVSIVSDGFHSLADSASNVVALVGISAARRPPDENHPYGHRKFETLAAGGIFSLLAIAVIEVVRSAVGQLRAHTSPHVSTASFAVMLGTVVVNLLVVTYESRAGRRLASEILLADARHTRSDVATSLTVLAALVGVELGWPLLDPVAGLVVAGFIVFAGSQIARDTSRILSDEIVLDQEALRRSVMKVPGIVGSHQIRTRGSRDHVFLDMHIWLDPDTPLHEAHRLSHVVKDVLMERHPELADVVIHIEPPPGTFDPGPSDAQSAGRR